MVIDINAYIGHYPFRQTKYHTAAELVALMDKYGVGKSCVASLNAIYYKDCIRGDIELLEEIKPYKDRLIPFCVLNPEYNCAMDDFKKCINNLGFKGLRLFPKQHGYKLDGGPAVEMLKAAGEMGIPVHIPVLLEDLRGYHPLDTATEITAVEVKNAALLAPDTTFMLSNSYLEFYAKEIEPAFPNHSGKVFYDIGRDDCIYAERIKNLVSHAGYGKLLFGTGAMLQNIPVQFVKLAYMGPTLGATPEQVEAVASGNAIKILGL